MPHSCIGAFSHYHHGFVAYVLSDDAFRLVEVTAAGVAVYHICWRPLQKMVLPVVVIVVVSASISKLESSDVSLFLHRITPCLPKARLLPSPEPEKTWPKREAYNHEPGPVS
jgi:hypothetical protein